MSLFKVREWWSTTSGFEEFHDLGCLCVANLENLPAEFGMCVPTQSPGPIFLPWLLFPDKIVVGSFQGLLRIYEPHAPRFEPGHVVLEKQLGHAIIQITAGQFIP